MEPIVVKIREKGTMFQDLSQGRVVVGNDAVVVARTPTINKAIASGRLTRVEGAEEKAAIKAYQAAHPESIEKEDDKKDDSDKDKKDDKKEDPKK